MKVLLNLLVRFSNFILNVNKLIKAIRLLFVVKKIFCKNILTKIVALIFTLHLVPFESKLVKYSTQCQSLNASGKSMFYNAFVANSKR